MKTISEIIELAIESRDNLPAAMLHCKVLADGLGHEPFNAWVTRELNGYGDPREVPDYRRVRGRLKGNYERYFVDITLDAVPPQILGSEAHSLVETVIFSQPVGTLATFRDDGSLGFPVGMEKELFNIINSHFGTHGRFVTLWVRCFPDSIHSVLVSIQHKLVSFLSELNQLFPAAEEVVAPNAAESAAIDGSFDKHLSVGHANNIIISPSYVHVDQSRHVFQQINVENWPELDSFLGKQNIPEERREELKEILDRLDSGNDLETVQGQLKDWVEESASGMASEVGDVLKEATKKAAKDTLVEGIKKYAPSIAKWGWVVATSVM